MKLRYVLTILIFFFLMAGLTACGGGEAAQEDKENSAAAGDSSKTDSTKNDQANAEDKKKEENSDFIPVEVTSIGRGEISSFILLSSNLETEIQADVYARAQGIVESIRKEEGGYVKKGEIMLQLEAREFEIAENKARVEYEKQLSNYKRLQGLYDEDLLSDEEFEQAKFTKDAALYTWEDAKLRLDYMSIRSPINGQVGERLAKIGARIQPADKLFSVVNNTQAIAVVYVPEKNIDQLKTNQQAIISSDNLGEKEYGAFIKRISPVVDPASGTFKVTVGLKEKTTDLKTGMFVNVKLIIETHENALLLPKTAVVYENEYMNVFVVRDSMAHKIRLNPGFEDAEKIEVVDQLEDGEKVIVVGQAGLKDKTKVRIVAERENKILASADKK